tara:strand:+ start:225 stop:608 length:384 start_codon:yes stop_codon:yes gene_type:complete
MAPSAHSPIHYPPDWYLRDAAFWAIVGLHADISGEEFSLLTEMYSQSQHVFERVSFDSGFQTILKSGSVIVGEQGKLFFHHLRFLTAATRYFQASFEMDLPGKLDTAVCIVPTNSSHHILSNPCFEG